MFKIENLNYISRKHLQIPCRRQIAGGIEDCRKSILTIFQETQKTIFLLSLKSFLRDFLQEDIFSTSKTINSSTGALISLLA